MTKRRQPSKPSGTTGHLAWAGPDAGTYHQLTLPADPQERERFVVEALFRDQHHGGPDLRALYGITGHPQKNPDANEFPDFYLIDSTCGVSDLELTEFAPLAHFGAYSDVPHEYEQGRVADLAVIAIMNKWNRYGESARGAALVMYTADWRLHLDERLVELIRRTLSRERHGFSSVVYYALWDDLGGQLYSLFPRTTEPPEDFDEATERQRTKVRGDLTGGRP